MSQFSSSIQFSQVLNFLDIAVIVGCFLFTIFFVGRWKKKYADHSAPSLIRYMVAGRRLSLPVFVATLVASWYGGIFGVSEIAFQYGIYNFFTQGVFWYVAYLVFAFWIAPKIAHHNYLSLPHMIHESIGPKAGKVTAVFTFFNMLPVSYLLSLALFFEMLTGMSLLPCLFIAGAIAALYSFFGGMETDVASDVVQFFLMISSVAIVLLLSVYTFGGVSFLQAKLPASYFKPTSEVGFLETFVWGIVALQTLIDPTFLQRTFALQKPAMAKRGIIICTVIWCLFDLCTTFGTMYARALIPEAKASHSYIIYAIQLLPNGLRGFFIAGIIAIIVSTLDSFMLVASQSVSFDLFGKKNLHKLSTHKLTHFIIVLLMIGLALLFDGSVKKTWKIMGSYASGCLVFPVLTKIFFPKLMDEKTFLWSTLTSALIITLFRLDILSVGLKIDALYFGLVSCLCTLGIRNFIKHVTS